MGKTYRGRRTVAVSEVCIDGHENGERPLPLRDPIYAKGFEWGYIGSGSRQLAYALLADVSGNETVASHLCEQFMFDIIAGLHDFRWMLTEDNVAYWLRNQNKT